MAQLYGEAAVGCAYPVGVPQDSELRTGLGLHVVLHVLGTNTFCLPCPRPAHISTPISQLPLGVTSTKHEPQAP